MMYMYTVKETRKSMPALNYDDVGRMGNYYKYYGNGMPITIDSVTESVIIIVYSYKFNSPTIITTVIDLLWLKYVYKANFMAWCGKVIFLLNFVTGMLVSCSNISVDDECPPWSYYSLNTHQCECYHNALPTDDIICTDTGVTVGVGYCATYQENVGTFFAECFYFQLPHGNYTDGGFFSLPNNVSELNEFMCGPMKRTGLVCSECIDGYGPSVTSFGYQCAECSDSWSGVLLYILIEFVPATLFYFIVLTFRINVTSAPMPLFIMYSQFIVYTALKDPVILNKTFVQSHSKIVKYIFVAIASLYGFWNLDFLRYMVPPMCISSKLGIIHIELLECLSALYSLSLIVITWICVELHGSNCRPLVLLWRPFHRCFVRLRKHWDISNDVIDVSATFLLLTYSKFTYQSLQMLSSQHILKNGALYMKVNLYDPSISFMSGKHVPFVIVSLVLLVLFIIPLPFILLLYPTKQFSGCLTICRLNGRSRAALQTFVEKFYGCYEDNYIGVRDRKRFSALYFYMRGAIIALYYIRTVFLSHNLWFFGVLLLTCVLLLISYVQPYKKSYMNILDTLLLAHMALLCSLLSTPFDNALYAMSLVVLISLPLTVFLLYLSWYFLTKLLHFYKKCAKLKFF